MAESGTRFVVKRLNWIEHYNGSWLRQPGEVAVVSFATFEEADAERAKRESEMRKKVNPFACGAAVHFWSHLDEPRLRDWLMDRGIDPPAAKNDGTTDWAGWWKKSGKKLSPEKRESVWEALDKMRFFMVREEPVRPVGYAVVEVHWEYNDNYYDANPSCGQLLKVYRLRERAEAECARRNEEAREQWSADYPGTGEPEAAFNPDEDMPAFDMQDRIRHRRGLSAKELQRGEGQFSSAEGVPFFEIIEVALEGLE